jgi:hypothetical protein
VAVLDAAAGIKEARTDEVGVFHGSPPTSVVRPHSSSRGNLTETFTPDLDPDTDSDSDADTDADPDTLTILPS